MNETKNEEDVLIKENALPQEFILKALGHHEARGMWGIKNTRDPIDTMVKHAKTQNLSLPLVQVVITKEGIFVNPITSKLDCQVHEGPSHIRTPTQKQYFEGFHVHNPKNVSSRKDEKTFDGWSSMSRNQKTLRDAKNDGGKRFNGKFNFFQTRKREEKEISKELVTDLKILDKFSRFDWKRAGITFYGIDTISYGVQDLIFTRVFSMIVVLDRQTRESIGADSAFMCHAFVCESRSTAKRITYALAAAFQAYGRAVKHLKENEFSRKVIFQAKPKNFVIDLRPPSELTEDFSEV